jgi:hypothetical protein
LPECDGSGFLQPIIVAPNANGKNWFGHCSGDSLSHAERSRGHAVMTFSSRMTYQNAGCKKCSDQWKAELKDSRVR